VWRRASSKGKSSDFLELILQRHFLKKALIISITQLHDRGYLNNIVEKTLAEVKFLERKYALQEKQKVQKIILPFVTKYNPLVLKKILMSKWHIIEKQPLLREIFREPPIISYKRSSSLKDILVRAKL